MNEQEFIKLRQENIRQQEIIDQLLEFNRLLRKENALPRSENGTNESIYSVPRSENGTEQSIYSNQEKENGINGGKYSNLSSDNGIKEVNDSILQPWNGIIGAKDSNQQTENGTNGSINTVPQPENHGNGIHEALLARINASPENVLIITQRIKAQKLLLLSKRKGAQMVKLLVHINNKEGGSAAAMCHATGYSKSGLAKTLMSLRKKGIVIKHKVRNYQLTQSGINLMQGLR